MTTTIAAPAAANTLLLKKQNLSNELADRLIAGAVAKAKEMGVPMSIAISDADGTLVRFQRMDNASLISLDIAQNKAYSSAATGMPTDTLHEFIKGDAPLAAGLVHTPRLVVFGGGYPVIVGGTVVGAIGVSGGHYSQDMEVARAALASVSLMAPLVRITGAELLARALANEGVRFVFGTMAPESDPFLAALEGNGMEFIPTRHESAAVHMAEGVYKTTGQVAAVLGNPGPGSVNLIPGIVTARHEGVPVIAITPQHRLGLVYPTSPATYQGENQLELFKPAVKWGAPMFEWTRIPEIVRMGMREMWNGRPGPIQFEIPGPMMYTPGDPATATIFPSSQGRASLPQASAQQLEAAVQMLATARAPVIFAGCGVDRAGANQALLAVAERLGAPVLPSMAGRGVFPRDHPLYFGSQSPTGDALRKNADVMLIVGSRVGTIEVPFDKYWGDPKNCRVIQIDIDSRNIGVSRPVTLGIVSDARVALEGLAHRLEQRQITSHGRTDLADMRQQFDQWTQGISDGIRSWKGAGIHTAHACAAVGEVFGQEAVYCLDGGLTTLWSSVALPATRPSSYHSILELGMLGVGIPAAIGAKLAAPSRDVVCITGDGAAGFNIMEMQVAANEGIKVVVVVIAEGEWGMSRINQLARWGRTFKTTMGKVSWDQVAEGLGCHGEYVETMNDLAPALQRAKSAPGPALVCVRTDREAHTNIPRAIASRFMEVYTGPTP
jgi:acetolactate synthase-1/2/3 large subunit